MTLLGGKRVSDIKGKLIRVRNFIFIFVISNFVMICTMAVSYLIPNSVLRDNVEKSYQILQKEGTYPSFVDFDRIFFYDNYTDYLIVSTVYLQPENNILINALENNVSKLGRETYTPAEGLAQLLEDETQYAPYMHYWCWIASLLKVMFLLWNIGEIRLIIFSIGVLLAGIVLYKLKKNINLAAAAGLAIALISGGCLTNIMCIAFCTDIILMYSGILIIVLLYERNKEILFRNETYIFFILGMLCFMLNYWSMPTITLCGPLVVLALLKIKENRNVCYVKDIMCDSICWGMGLGAEVLFRVLISYVVSGEATALDNLNMYAGAAKSMEIRLRMETIYYSIAKYFTRINKYIFVMAVIILCVCLAKALISQKGIKKSNIYAILSFGIIAAIPLVWIGVLYNHTFHGFDILPICMSSFAFTSVFAAQLKMNEEHCET